MWSPLPPHAAATLPWPSRVSTASVGGFRRCCFPCKAAVWGKLASVGLSRISSATAAFRAQGGRKRRPPDKTRGSSYFGQPVRPPRRRGGLSHFYRARPEGSGRPGPCRAAPDLRIERGACLLGYSERRYGQGVAWNTPSTSPVAMCALCDGKAKFPEFRLMWQWGKFGSPPKPWSER